MQNISLELVPRSIEALISELEFVKDNFPEINVINIPDLMRYQLRSWECSTLVRDYDKKFIPHIRAIDFRIKDQLPIREFLVENSIDQVLVITGDSPQDMTRKVYPTTSLDMIKRIKSDIPGIKVFAAIDQYRNSIRKEYELINRKIDAGADGFFTQPFFDIRLIEIYAELLEGQDVYWGISPVNSEKSHTYWETKNNVVFPKGFKPTVDWNIAFAREALSYLRENQQHVYLMPIRIDLKTYLDGIMS